MTTNQINVIGVTHIFNNTISILPPVIDIQGSKVLIHDCPELEYDGTVLVKNFDLHIDFNVNMNRLHNQLLPDSYRHYPRQRRSVQAINVSLFNNKWDKVRLHMPRYYLASPKCSDHLGITNFGTPKCEKVVIKEEWGARGSNQVVVPTNMLTTLLKHSKGKTLDEVRVMFPDLIYTENSDWDMLFFDNLNELFISELIPNIRSEYRLLVGGDNIYARERSIKVGPYPQANLDTDKFHTVTEVTYEPIEEIFDTSLVETLYEFVKFIDLPIGSIDLYATTDGKWGIFEYSTQFAFHGANPNFIRQLLIDGIHLVIAQVNSKSQSVTKQDTSSDNTGNIYGSLSPSTEAVTQLFGLRYDRLIHAITSVQYPTATVTSVDVENLLIKVSKGDLSLEVTKDENDNTILYLPEQKMELITYVKNAPNYNRSSRAIDDFYRNLIDSIEDAIANLPVTN